MPVQNKTFRVFISSTFADMRTERRTLQEKVFPQIKKLCESRGFIFQAIDLRWGINEDNQLDQKTIDICLNEISRCQQLSPKPNFIALLGDRYGWQPTPPIIPASEMNLILSKANEEDTILINKWYKLDENAISPEFVLQSRGGDYKEYTDWNTIENKLLQIFRKIVNTLPLKESERIKYFTSATHQEIINGALKPEGSEDHVFAYFRKISNLDSIKEKNDFVDWDGNSRDLDCKENLEKLKFEINGKLSEKGHVRNYAGHIEEASNNRINTLILENETEFETMVLEDLQKIITSQLNDTIEENELIREIKIHEEFKKDRIKNFTGRTEVLKNISDYIVSEESIPLIIVGESGSGKSSIMAKAIDEFKNNKIFRFIGISSVSTVINSLLYQLCEEIAMYYSKSIQDLLEKDEEKKLSSIEGLSELLKRCLSLSSPEKPLVIVLDALDQLQDTKNLSWIPTELPLHNKIIVSVLPELKGTLKNCMVLEIGQMPKKDAGILLDSWLTGVGRKLQPKQKNEILSKFNKSGLPLFLKLAFEQAKKWHSYSEDNILKEDSIEGILRLYFDELEKDHKNELVKNVCGYLLSGKYRGLTESEILGILEFDEDYWKFFLNDKNFHREEVEKDRQLPIVIWSRLFLDLEPYLTTKDAEGEKVIGFFHRQFFEYATKRYLSEKDSQFYYHNNLADYYEEQPLYLDDERKTPNIRKLSEQPFQQLQSHQWDDIVTKSLGNFEFQIAAIQGGLLKLILDEYDAVLKMAPKAPKLQLKIWSEFFKEKIHVLRRGSLEWHPFKIFLQLASEHADVSPLTIEAEKWLDKKFSDLIWIKRINNRPKQIEESSVLAVFEGHRGWITNAVELTNGDIISCAAVEEPFIIWNNEGAIKFKIDIGKSFGGSVLQTSKGDLLLWSAKNALFLYDKEGNKKAEFIGHNSPVKGAIELNNGNILSWSNEDFDLIIWSISGENISILEGHKKAILNSIEINSGVILSWSSDKTFRIWSHEKKQIIYSAFEPTRFYGALKYSENKILIWDGNRIMMYDLEKEELKNIFLHDEKINNIIRTGQNILIQTNLSNNFSLFNISGNKLMDYKTSDTYSPIEKIRFIDVISEGRVLSADRTGNFYIWDTNGMKIKTLKGHAHPNLDAKAVELKNGKILTWASDKKMIKWSVQKPDSQLQEIVSHKEYIDHITELQNGNIISQSDSSLIWWNSVGEALVKLPKTSSISSNKKCFFETNDGIIVTWDNESNNIVLCDGFGNKITELNGHKKQILNCIPLNNNRILSWSSNTNELFLWSLKDKTYLKLEGHNGKVIGALQVSNHNIISWADDKSIIFRNEFGNIIKKNKHNEKDLYRIEVQNNRVIIAENRFNPNPKYVWDFNGLKIRDYEISTTFNNESQSSFVFKRISHEMVMLKCTNEKSKKNFPSVYWNSSSYLARISPPTIKGICIIANRNGELCFLQLHKGNRPIGREEMELILEKEQN